MSSGKTRAEREARLRSELAEMATLRIQVNLLVGQLRHYEALIIGAAEGIGKLLSPIDGVLTQLEKNPKAVKDSTFHAFLLHLKSEREKLTNQEVQLRDVAAQRPILSGRLPGAPLAPTPEQVREADAKGPVGERPGAGDPPITE